MAGLVLLGAASGGLAWSLVGGDDLRLLVDEPRDMALLGVGVVVVDRVRGAARALPGRRACRAARGRTVPSSRAARRGGGVPAAPALPRDRRRRPRARVPDPPRRAARAAAVPDRPAARRLRHARGDLVPVDLGRACRSDRARVLRLPVRRRIRGRRPSAPRRLAPARAARHARRARHAVRRRSGSGRRRRARCSSHATSRSPTRTRRSSGSRRSSRIRACTDATS